MLTCDQSVVESRLWFLLPSQRCRAIWDGRNEEFYEPDAAPGPSLDQMRRCELRKLAQHQPQKRLVAHSREIFFFDPRVAISRELVYGLTPAACAQRARIRSVPLTVHIPADGDQGFQGNVITDSGAT